MKTKSSAEFQNIKIGKVQVPWLKSEQKGEKMPASCLLHLFLLQGSLEASFPVILELTIPKEGQWADSPTFTSEFQSDA